MSVKPMSNLRLKAAVSVSQMAKMVSLSRARFYDLVGRGVFLQPVYSLVNRRPFYTADMQAANLEARQTGIGCDGAFTLFYERNQQASAPRRPVPAPTRQDRSGLIEGLKSLGLTAVTIAQVEEALATNYPNGTAGVDENMVLRTVYRHVRRLGTV